MKLKTVKYLGLGLAIAAGLTTAANASITYTWDNTLGIATSGTLTLNNAGTAVLSYTFDDGPAGTYSTSISLANPVPSVYGGAVGLTSGDAVLHGDMSPDTLATGGISGDYLSWNTPMNPSGPLEVVTDGNASYGYWVPVPEPTTMIAGALLLLPFGASTLRIVRKNRAA
jgi:hypothetical protein